MSFLRTCWLLGLLFAACAAACPALANDGTDPQPRAALRVLIDDNYPPYVFRDAGGTLTGYLVDLWRLWEERTGVRVELQASDWETAQRRMAERQGDVLDTAFRTPERERSLDFSPPYETIPVAIHTHGSIGGIVDTSTLRGFMVGVKAGDACVEHLAAAGIDAVQPFASYEALVQAAIDGKVRVFCLDEPPANYLLYRKNAEELFNRAFTLYAGDFHRAVHKGDAASLALLQRGFAAISPAEERRLRAKWMGTPLFASPRTRHLAYALLVGSLVGAALLVWVFTLRRVVRQRTAKLAATLNAVPDPMFELGLDGICHEAHTLRAGLLPARSTDLVGRRVSDVLEPAAAATCLAALREAQASGYSAGRLLALDLPQGRFWFELSVARKAQAGGREPRFVVLVRDVSERKRAEAALLRRSEQLELMSRVSQEINRRLDLAVILRQLVVAALKLVGAGGGAAARLQEDQMVFREYCRAGEWLPVDYRFAAGHGVPGRVLQTRCFHLSNDAANDPWVIPEIRRAIGFANLLDIPIIGRDGELLGCFEIHDKPGGFDAEDVGVLQGLAASAAVALENAALLAERQRVEVALRESEAQQALVLASAACGIVATDPDGLITLFNPGAEVIFGYRADEVLGRATPMLWHDPDEVRAVAVALRATLGIDVEAGFDALVVRARVSGEADEREMSCIRKDGRRISVRLAVTVMRDDGGQLKGYLGTVVDVSEQKRAAAELNLAAQVFERGGEGIAITDASCRMVMVNRAFTHITGYSAAEVLGRNPGMLASGRHDAAFFRGMWEAIESEGSWQGEIWNRRKDGSVYPEWLSISRVESEGVTTHYLGSFIDLTRHKEAEASIQRLAHYDALTGLPNRSLLAERVRHDLARAHRAREPLALMFLDLDRFKNVNDSLGHQVGDELLVQVARRLRRAVRDDDTVARLGGDEFIVVLANTDADGAAHVASKLLEVTAPAYRVGQHELSCTISAGIAMYPADGDSFESLSMCADTAMYRAKQVGRNDYCFFTVEMQQRSARTLQIENELRRAVELGQLSLHFQPQFALDDGRLLGAEALLRWQHPELGMVSPAEFIPIAEDCGLILSIGEWVLRMAVRQMRIWHGSGLPELGVAVNLSAMQFRQAGLPALVARILDNEGLPAHFLELELTESVAMDQPLAAIVTMDQLRALGVRMSIDDFGTGYSSMSYLKRFPVHKLKIDRSFVADLASDPDDEAIVAATISLAHNLGLQTIAEGVESEAQLAFLRAKGCDQAQGHLFSQPLPAARFAAWATRPAGATWRGE
ncbi:EAL domain-containing protein [Accumulibacter sp.]|uniref:EAL domain-containing protein n=1 Tax=Accumulibacter sp. TaxID=2053492 RepID=UPI0025D7FD94|nr:EAL domain-containing protein [Accumulibacter sp.]MCM8612258.1 EAL domain-containing protein [Accumulibacter sp.]MCM8635931.1 EAL domain-containing protein [Accumulibacter sp.]MCM8639460.1 EAL domain-containing protein [Accumulibacter sp.]